MARRATQVCPKPGCHELRPCPRDGHERKAWEGSTRRRRLPPDWERRRARILRRDPMCRVCMEAPSQEVDHIQPSGSDDDPNLQGICKPCHAEKTKREAAAGRARNR